MNYKNKKSIILALILTILIAIPIVSLPNATAQTSGEMASFAYLIVEPNPVGVGQTTYIAMIVDVPLPSATEANDIRRHDYELTITAPDGTVQQRAWARVADTTGVQSTSFTPDQIGTYTFIFTYPDQNIHMDISTRW